MITPTPTIIDLLKKIKAKEPLGPHLSIRDQNIFVVNENAIGALLDLLLYRYVVVDKGCSSTQAYPVLTGLGQQFLDIHAPETDTTLTGDELALIQMTVQEMMGLYAGRQKCEFNDVRLRLMGELNQKLESLLNYVYPGRDEDTDLECNGWPIMTLDHERIQRIHDRVDKAQERRLSGK